MKNSKPAFDQQYATTGSRQKSPLLGLKKQTSRIDFDGVEDMINSRIQATRVGDDSSFQYSESSMLRKKGPNRQNNVMFLEE